MGDIYFSDRQYTHSMHLLLTLMVEQYNFQLRKVHTQSQLIVTMVYCICEKNIYCAWGTHGSCIIQGFVDEKWFKTSDLDGMWKVGRGVTHKGDSLHFHKVLGIVSPI